MLFSNTDFLVFFFPALLICYFMIPQGKNGERLGWKNTVLLVFSLIFYVFNGLKPLGVLLLSVVVNYTGGFLMSIPKSKTKRKIVLTVFMFMDFGILGWYKYAGFAAEAVNAIGFSVAVPQVLLPAGISFFTFQGASYVIDVYREKTAVQKNPLKVALYITLFPQLVAGPIVRYTTVECELNRRTHTLSEFSYGAERFMIGFGKKMILANAMGEIADSVFASLPAGMLTTLGAWIGAIAYTFQIYFDFSAYSDMAIGLGRIFGFRFEENFNYPYIATSITDFWRRWHISLSSWFRDYVYIPMGGNRCSKARHIFNLLTVWTLTGLWHGASWNFVLWGLFFGVLLIAEKYVFDGLIRKTPIFLRRLITMLIVVISWVLFRSDTVGYALKYIGIMFGTGNTLSVNTDFYYIFQYAPELILCLIAVFPVGKAAKKLTEKLPQKWSVILINTMPKLFALIVFGFGYMKLISGSFNPFIYFRF